MGMRMPQDQPTQAVTADQGNTDSPSPATTPPQKGGDDPGVPMADLVQRAVAKNEQGRTSLPRLLTHPGKASVTPLPTDTPGSLPRPSFSLHSPKLWAGFPPGKMASPKYIFLHEDHPTIPGWRRGGVSLRPSAQGHWKAPVIPPQTSMFRCVFPWRFDTQHSKVLVSNA